MKGKVFTAQEVQSIIAGNKRMFREVIKAQHSRIDDCDFLGQCLATDDKKEKGFVAYFQKPKTKWLDEDKPTGVMVKCPYQVGQKIFCKETFCLVDDEEHGGEKWIDYRATPKYEESHPAGWDNDPKHPEALKWKPAQHMKQEHSRLTLLIKSIGVERLQDISEEYARKEGSFLDRCDCLPRRNDETPLDKLFRQTACWQHGQQFVEFWNATHKKPEDKFEANCWVWVVSFEVINN